MEQHPILFESWSKIGHLVVLAALGYLSLVFGLRVSGKRTLTKLNVFDFVFVVALGSTLASIALSPDVTLADGLFAFLTLISLQVLLSWLCVTTHWVDDILNGEPTLLMHKGNFLDKTLKRQRITREEILSALRSSHVRRYEDVDSVVLETDGTFSIVWQNEGEKCSTLTDVKGHPDYEPDQERMHGD